MHFVGESARLGSLVWFRWRLRFGNFSWCARHHTRSALAMRHDARVSCAQTITEGYFQGFELLRKLNGMQRSPELAKALVLMAELPELPEEPEQPAPKQPAPDVSQAMVTAVSDAAYNERLQTIMQRLTSQEAVYDANADDEIATLKDLLVSGEKRAEALYVLLRWCCTTDDDDALAHMALEAGADPNYRLGYGPPLHMACLHSCPRIAKLLLRAHASPNAVVPYLPRKKGGSAVKRTALDMAITRASPEIIQILLEAGADFNVVRIHEGVTYDAMQVHGALDTTVALPTASSQTLTPNLQVLQTYINSNTEKKQVSALELCSKKVEYAMKRGERDRLRWVAVNDTIR